MLSSFLLEIKEKTRLQKEVCSRNYWFRKCSEPYLLLVGEKSSGMKFLREKHKTCLWPCVLMAQGWGCHPPVHIHHPTDWVLPPPPGGQRWLPPALQGQRNAGNGVSYLSGELIPTARELFTEVVPAGQTRPPTLPVCVLAQIFIHFLRKTMKCNKPWGGWDLWKLCKINF